MCPQVVREVQTENTAFTPVRMSNCILGSGVIKKKLTNVVKDVKKLEPGCTVGGKVE